MTIRTHFLEDEHEVVGWQFLVQQSEIAGSGKEQNSQSDDFSS